MRASRRRAGLLLALLCGLVSPAWAGEATDCDRLAASPHDPARTAPGVPFAALDAPAALAACQAALAAAPGEPRLAFQLGRAQAKGGDFAAARASYTTAAEGGHLAALHNLAALFAEGQGVERNLATALRLYLLAAERGFAPSQFQLGLAYLAGQGIVADRAKGLAWIRLAAGQDFVPAREWLVANQEAQSPQ